MFLPVCDNGGENSWWTFVETVMIQWPTQPMVTWYGIRYTKKQTFSVVHCIVSDVTAWKAKKVHDLKSNTEIGAATELQAEKIKCGSVSTTAPAEKIIVIAISLQWIFWLCLEPLKSIGDTKKQLHNYLEFLVK